MSCDETNFKNIGTSPFVRLAFIGPLAFDYYSRFPISRFRQ
jgi:hypothetical protein